MRKFKMERIHTEIVRREMDDHCTQIWLRDLSLFYKQWL